MITITAKTPKGAAKATTRALVKLATDCGYKGDSLPVYRDQSDGFDAPTVTWEEGFYEWPIILSAGGSMLSHDLGWFPYAEGGAEIDLVSAGGDWFGEPVNGYQLAFYKF